MENKCNLQMKDLYFSKIEFSQVKDQSNLEPINLKYKYDIDTISDKKDIYSVEKVLSIDISDENGKIDIKIIANGLFCVDCNSIEDSELIQRLLDNNTIAIMMPYLRSEVTLVTSQPGLTPIILPPVNVIELVENTRKK